MKKLLPVILAFIGLGVGTGAGVFLRPTDTETSSSPGQATSETASLEKSSSDLASQDTPATGHEAPPASENTSPDNTAAPEGNSGESHEFVKLNNQFIVPVVNGSKVTSLVVMSLSIEVASGDKEIVFAREPKLRDAFLQVLFDHANSGGFDGAFTSGEKMRDLRGSLLEAAIRVLGPTTSNVLVIDIVRQDV